MNRSLKLIIAAGFIFFGIQLFPLSAESLNPSNKLNLDDQVVRDLQEGQSFNQNDPMRSSDRTEAELKEAKKAAAQKARQKKEELRKNPNLKEDSELDRSTEEGADFSEKAADKRLLKEERLRLQQDRASRRSDLRLGNVKKKSKDAVIVDEQELSDELPDELQDLAASKLSKVRSRIESIFVGNFPDDVSRDLGQFGYNLFEKAPNDFSPMEDVPVNPDYIVGSGDRFTVHIWGSLNANYTVTVRRDGQIFIPKVGTLKVFGDSFAEMSKKIEKRLASYYSGIKVNVATDSVRNIDVFVIGEVSRPGSYSVPSTASPLNVLFQAGGATKNGSLRNISIVRGNKTIANVDLYDFLINGKHSFQSLQSQDVILVPVVGKVTAVAGNLKRPAIYEFQTGTSLYDVLMMAGGLSFTGEAGRLELQRVNGNQERITKTFQIPQNWRELDEKSAIRTDLSAKLEDGDLIKIFPVQSTIRRTIFLSGHVKRPGAYEFKEGMTVKDVLKSFDDLLPEPYTDFIEVIRMNPPKDERQALFVNFSQLVAGDESANLPLKERDEILVFSKDELNLREKVEIRGKVNRPGTFYFFDGMSLQDLIYMAGNVTQDAYLGNAEIARYSKDPDKLKLERLNVDLGATLKGMAEANPKLQPKDRVFIQGISNWEMQNYVTVSGEVKFPGTYPFLPGERLSSIVERAGGYSAKAFLPGAIFNRQSVREIQQRSLKQQITQLEEAIFQQEVNPDQNMSSSDRQSLQEAISVRKSLLKNLQQAEVTGRMVIQLEDMNKFRNSKYDIQLEPNDSLAVPVTPSVVTVMGEVYNPTSIIYTDGHDVQFYLDKAGGPTINADYGSIFIVKADGSVVSRQQHRGFLLKNFFQMEVARGDTILVPKDISRFSWLAVTKDITDVLFKIASTTGITIQAFK